jgi:hypothetical protein
MDLRSDDGGGSGESSRLKVQQLGYKVPLSTPNCGHVKQLHLPGPDSCPTSWGHRLNSSSKDDLQLWGLTNPTLIAVNRSVQHRKANSIQQPFETRKMHCIMTDYGMIVPRQPLYASAVSVVAPLFRAQT